VRDKGRNIRAEIKGLVEKHGGKFKTPVLLQAEEVIQLVHVGDAGNEKTLQAAKERGEKVNTSSLLSPAEGPKTGSVIFHLALSDGGNESNLAQQLFRCLATSLSGHRKLYPSTSIRRQVYGGFGNSSVQAQ
jgi:hypothetical protein